MNSYENAPSENTRVPGPTGSDGGGQAPNDKSAETASKTGYSPVTGAVSSVILRRSEGGEQAGGSFYEQVGGAVVFERLAAAFYRGVATDPVLRPMYPEDDLDPAERRLRMFLEQYWGGPTTYSSERGHPRLRMRHQPYKINPEAREHWLSNMRAALDTLELPPLQEATLWGYLERAAHAMTNTLES